MTGDVDDSDLPWGAQLRRWRAEVKLWSQQELVDQVVRLAFETKEDRGTRLDVRLVGKWESGSVGCPQSVYRRLLSGLGAPIPAGPTASAQPSMMRDQEQADSGRVSVEEANSTLSAAADVVMTYSTRGLISRSKWNDTIRGSTKSLWLYGMAELGYALDNDVPRIPQDAARSGCDIRILLLDPEYHGGVAIDADEGSPLGTSLQEFVRHWDDSRRSARNAGSRCKSAFIVHLPPLVSFAATIGCW